MAYIFLQQYQKALDDINKAIALAPGSPDDYALRAGIYEAMGEIAKAKEDRTRAQQPSGGLHTKTADHKTASDPGR